MAGKKPVSVASLQRGSYVIIDGVASKVTGTQTSRPGKHGAAKARLEIVGLFTGKRSSFLSTVDKRVNVPVIDKKQMQVTNVTEDSVQLMESETYEMFEEGLPSDEDVRKQLFNLFKEGKAVQAEVWDVMNRKKIVSVREMSI